MLTSVYLFIPHWRSSGVIIGSLHVVGQRVQPADRSVQLRPLPATDRVPAREMTRSAQAMQGSEAAVDGAYHKQASQCAMSTKVAIKRRRTAVPYSEYRSIFRATRTSRSSLAVFSRPISVVVCNQQNAHLSTLGHRWQTNSVLAANGTQAWNKIFAYSK